MKTADSQDILGMDSDFVLSNSKLNLKAIPVKFRNRFRLSDIEFEYHRTPMHNISDIYGSLNQHTTLKCKDRT